MSPGDNRKAIRFFPAEGGNGSPRATPDVSPGMARRLIVGHPLPGQRATSGSIARSLRVAKRARQPCGLTKTRSWRAAGRSAGVQGKVTNALRNFSGLQSAATFLAKDIPPVMRVRHLRQQRIQPVSE
jgi:hypothetical protein